MLQSNESDHPCSRDHVLSAGFPNAAVADNGVTGEQPLGKNEGDVTPIPEERQPWFSSDGSLLLNRYPFVVAQIEAAGKGGISGLAGFPLHAPLEERVRWAKANQWRIGGFYQRCSTKWQDSYDGQVRDSVALALHKRIMIFPEFMVGDEGVTGRKNRRMGIERLRQMIGEKRIGAIVTFSVSRWFRSLPKGLIFIREEVVDNGIRAVAKAENFDTNDPGWSDYLTLNLFVAEKMATGQSAFVRMGHRVLVEAGFLTGACPLGYKPEAVPGAGLTKQKKPKTRQMKHPRVASLIVKHYHWIDGGMSSAEGVRLWNEEIASWPPEDRKFAVDPRAKTPFMTPCAYARMLRREDYIGRVTYGATRSRWIGSKDRTVQEEAPKEEEVHRQREDLRIMPDDLFHRVQQRLDSRKTGEHGPRAKSSPPFHDRLVPMFHCGCGHRFTRQGARYMHCPRPHHECAEYGTVDRKQAAAALVEALRREVLGNASLVEAIVRESQALDRDGDGSVEREISTLQKAVSGIDNEMRLMELAARADTEKDPDRDKRYLDAANLKKRHMSELERLRRRKKETPAVITAEQVRDILTRFDDLLRRAAAGELGADGCAQAVGIVHTLTGGRIDVSFEKRDRRRRYGRARFRPALTKTLREHGNLDVGADLPGEEITLELRPLPHFERVAEDVHRLYAEEGLNLCDIARRLGCGRNIVWRAHAYWYKSRNLPRPALPQGAPPKQRA